MRDSGTEEPLITDGLSIISYEAICWRLGLMVFRQGGPFTAHQIRNITAALSEVTHELDYPVG